MCFYFGLPENIGVIKKRFQREVQQPERFVPSDKFNGFAHPENLIITNETANVMTTGHWGLLPHWTPDQAFRKNTLNARIETIDSLPSSETITTTVVSFRLRGFMNGNTKTSLKYRTSS